MIVFMDGKVKNLLSGDEIKQILIISPCQYSDIAKRAQNEHFCVQNQCKTPKRAQNTGICA